MMTAMKVCMCVGCGSGAKSEWLCVCDGVLYVSLFLIVPSFPLFSPPPLLDIAVGAPYEAGNGAGNGAVYIYYGRADMAQFMAQTPFQVLSLL